VNRYLGEPPGASITRRRMLVVADKLRVMGLDEEAEVVVQSYEWNAYLHTNLEAARERCHEKERQVYAARLSLLAFISVVMVVLATVATVFT
jgi:hypothetical protein